MVQLVIHFQIANQKQVIVNAYQKYSVLDVMNAPKISGTWKMAKAVKHVTVIQLELMQIQLAVIKKLVNVTALKREEDENVMNVHLDIGEIRLKDAIVRFSFFFYQIFTINLISDICFNLRMRL